MAVQRLYSVPEAAKELRRGKNAVYRMVYAGELACIAEPGHPVLIPAQAIEAWIARHQQQTAELLGVVTPLGRSRKRRSA